MRTTLALTVLLAALVGRGPQSTVRAESEKNEEKHRVPLTDGLIVDAETGLQYRKAASLTGERDKLFLKYSSLSPNGRFLVALAPPWVVPLDGGDPFRLVDLPACGLSLSPDAQKLVFISRSIWLLPVSPDTGKPRGPVQELIHHDRYSLQGGVWWSPDSERFVFIEEEDRSLWIYSLPDRTTSQLTKDRSFRVPIGWSPDGHTIACYADKAIHLLPLGGGPSRKLADAAPRAWEFSDWSPDGKWILTQDGGNLGFIRVTDGLHVDVALPKALAKGGTYYVRSSFDGKKLLLYRSSRDWQEPLKLVSASGGASFSPGKRIRDTGYWYQWSADSKFLVAAGERGDEWQDWVIPLAGDDPFPLQLKVSLDGEVERQSLSRDMTKLLFSLKAAAEEETYWVIPVSIREGRTTGTPVKVFDKPDAYFYWSPDGTKLAVRHQDDLWIARTDGKTPTRLTETPEQEWDPQWSPDGKAIAWKFDAPGKTVLYVKHLSEGPPKKLAESFAGIRYAWSPDGSRIAYGRPVSKNGNLAISIIAVSGGEPTRVLETRHRNFWFDWSPDGKELAVLADGKISAVSLPDGKLRQIMQLEREDPLTIRNYWGFKWSPDGRTIAFACYLYDAVRGQTRLFTVDRGEGKPTELATDDMADKYRMRFSPDGQWLSYSAADFVKVRAESSLWEVELGGFLEKAAAKASKTGGPSKP